MLVGKSDTKTVHGPQYIVRISIINSKHEWNGNFIWNVLVLTWKNLVCCSQFSNLGCWSFPQAPEHTIKMFLLIYSYSNKTQISANRLISQSNKCKPIAAWKKNLCYAKVCFFLWFFFCHAYSSIQYFKKFRFSGPHVSNKIHK